MKGFKNRLLMCDKPECILYPVDDCLDDEFVRIEPYRGEDGNEYERVTYKRTGRVVWYRWA